MLNFLRASRSLIFDFETSGTRWFQKSRPCGLALGSFDDQGRIWSYYVPYRHFTGEQQLDIARIGPAFKELLENPWTLKIGHNVKFDRHMARTEGWNLQGPIYDTMVGARFYDENRFIGLKVRAAEDLGRAEEAAFEDKLKLYVKGLAKARGLGYEAYLAAHGYSEVPVNLCGHYACYDIDFTGSLHQLYEKWGMSWRFSRIWPTEMALVGVLGDMEEWGLSIDPGYLEHLRDILAVEMAGLNDRIQTMLGRPIELSKDEALRNLLFGKGPGCMGLTPFKKTKSFQDAVDREVLEYYADGSPVLKLIMDWRDAHKLSSTYTDSILDRLDLSNILHGELLQAGTDTGRLASKEPNLQNFPSDDDERAKKATGKKVEDGGIDPWSIKRAFCNRGPGWVRLYFDYSQIELRVLAFYSRDPIMVEAYLKGEDIHTRTSMEVFGTKDASARRKAKVINFGLSYCLSAGGLARQAKMSYDDAEAFMRKFFERYHGVATFREEFWNSVRVQDGQFQNLFGRPRRTPGIFSHDRSEAERAKRQAIGSLIQGTAAELTKEALVRVARWLREEGIPARLCTTIHDELQVDTPVEYMARVATGVQFLMEQFPEFSPIPILAEGSYSTTNWAEKKKLPAPKKAA